MLIQLLFTDPLLFLIIGIGILLAISIHEYSHAQMADFLGDPTAKYHGRLTINPIAHLDLFGTLLLFFFGFGWGKPVPFNPYNLRNPKQGEILVGLAGPLSNFLMAIISGLIFRSFPFFKNSLFLIYFIWINIALAVFNLLPLPPLDGSYIFLNIFPQTSVRKFILLAGPFLVIFALFFMLYVGFPFIVQPLFKLITGISLPI
jgi:Zn-dependent protease